jgi:hypothetical protein
MADEVKASTAEGIPDKPQTLKYTSGGFELYVPPTKFAHPPEPARFVMLDDINDTFYQVLYEGLRLKNTTPWTDLALHTTPDPAIVFPPNQQEIFDAKLSITATGFLVSIISRANGEFVAKWLGTVHVDRLPEQSMNWGALESLKGDELPAEMRNGLLRFVFNRRPGASGGSHSYVTPRGVLDGLERPWYKDGASLAWELDDRFVGGKRIEREQRWKLVTS